MKLASITISWLAMLSLAPAPAAPPPPAVDAVPATSAAQFGARARFELLPKAFQSNPILDMTVITEVTDHGKKLPPVSPQVPAYYVFQSAGYHVVGEPVSGKSLASSEVEVVLRQSLATHGYLPAMTGHPPTLMIVYFWGAHNLFDQEDPALSAAQWTNNILDRAALAGGEKFAAELSKAIDQSDAIAAASSSHFPGTASDGSPTLGAAQGVAVMNARMDPVRLFTQQSAKNEFLVDQAESDCYYVVASAYDFASVGTQVKQLLWRTRMTVNALGVSQPQSLPKLIASAGPYFGKEMTEAEVLMEHAVPEGKVQIGTPTVVNLPPAAPEAQKK